jgi:hypothetical protein
LHGKLPPLDQVPAVQDAAHAFNSFAHCLDQMAEDSQGLLDRLTSMRAELTAKATALNGLEGQIASGDYLAKAKVTEACELARTKALDEMKPVLRATRKRIGRK